MPTAETVFKEASTLDPFERARLIDKLIDSLDRPDKEIDELWAKEVENRIDAYEMGKIKAVTLKEALEKYR